MFIYSEAPDWATETLLPLPTLTHSTQRHVPPVTQVRIYNTLRDRSVRNVSEYPHGAHYARA